MGLQLFTNILNVFRRNPKASEQAICHEQQAQKTEEIALTAIEEMFWNSPYIDPTKGAWILEELKQAASAGPYPDTRPIVRREPLMTLAEKKKAGINTRLKLSKHYFESLTDEGKKQDRPASIVDGLLSSGRTKEVGENKLQQYKEIGIEFVSIVNCHDGRDCDMSSQIAGKQFHISNAPELPLPQCDGDCRCIYRPVIPDL